MEHFRVAVKTDDHCGGLLSVLDDINSGKLQLWLWEDGDGIATFIVEIMIQRDGSKEFLIRMLSGEGLIEKYPEVSKEMIGYAKEMGCSRVTGYVKPAIADKACRVDGKLDPKFDFEERYIVMAKEI